MPGPVYSEDLTLLVRAGKQVPWQSFTVAELTVMGTFDETEVVARFRDHYFDRVIIYSRPSYIYDLRHSPAVRRAIEECYASESTIGEYEVLHPRPCS